MKSAGDLTRSIGELVAQRAIHDRDSGVNRGPGRLWLEAGLETEVIQQRRFGEISLQNVACTMRARPPPDKVQQVVCVKAKTSGRQASYVLAVQITIDPLNLAPGSLLDDVNRALSIDGRLVVNNAELHHCADSNSDRN